MKYSGVKAADPAMWSKSGNNGGSPATGGMAAHSPAEGIDGTAAARTDVSTFSELMQLRFLEEKRRSRKGRSQQDELSAFLEMAARSNDKIREIARETNLPGQIARAVPSTLGLTVLQAAERLKTAELKIRGVGLEYSDHVAAGQIISQMPVPGSLVPVGTDVHLLVSKGRMEIDGQ